jgi:transposase
MYLCSMSKKLILPCLEKATLEDIFRNHTKPYLRNRSQCMLLLSDGFKVSELAKIYKTRKHTIYEWLRLYEREGFIGLQIKKGRGLKSIMRSLDTPKIEIIKEEIANNPQNLKQVSTILSEKLGFTITKMMLKRYLKKKLKYTWHRIRKWLKPKQNQA